MSGRKRNILIWLAAAVLAQAAWGQSGAEQIRAGNRLYRDGDFAAALARYDQAAAEGPADSVLQYNRANCFYKLEDYDQASNLYREVSAESKDMALAAKAKYNLGNCHFQQGMKQRDGNLQKALEELSTSVRLYRETLDLNPEDEQARHNIAVARLVMKDILDAIKKQQEQQKQQQKQEELAEKIKELLKRQLELGERTGQAAEAASDPNGTAAEAFAPLGREQETLRKDTEGVRGEAEQMREQLKSQAAGAPPGQGGSAGGQGIGQADPIQAQQEVLETVTGELSQAVGRQQGAVEDLREKRGLVAKEEQGKAAEHLKRALEAFPKPPPQPQNQGQDQQNQNKDQQQDQQQDQKQDQKKDQGEEQPDPSQQDQTEPEAQAAPDTTAQAILDEEKENRDRRRQRPRGGYRPVDKDW